MEGLHNDENERKESLADVLTTSSTLQELVGNLIDKDIRYIEDEENGTITDTGIQTAMIPIIWGRLSQEEARKKVADFPNENGFRDKLIGLIDRYFALENRHREQVEFQFEKTVGEATSVDELLEVIRMYGGIHTKREGHAEHFYYGHIKLAADKLRSDPTSSYVSYIPEDYGVRNKLLELIRAEIR